MFRAKRDHDGFLAAFVASVIVARIPLSGASLDPHQLNPFRERDPDAEREIEEVKRFVAANRLGAQAREAKEAAGKRG